MSASAREGTSEQCEQDPAVLPVQELVYGPVNRPGEEPDGSTTIGDPSTALEAVVDGGAIKPPLLKDIEDPDASLGVCGLQNLGNTCYMNAGLQCLRSVSSLVHCFLETTPPTWTRVSDEQVKDKLIVCKGHVANRFSVLLQKLWSCRYASVRPQAFKATLGVRWNQFSDNRQHDCQEFMSVFLDSLHDDLQGSTHNGGDDKMEVDTHSTANETSHSGTSIVTDTFRGTLKNEVVCNTCQFSSIKEEPFFFLSVPIPHACERQIEITWVPVCTQMEFRRVVRLLVTVMNYGTVGDLKKAIITTVTNCTVLCDLLLVAEVKDGVILRVMSDSMLLKNLNDKDSSVYAFEMAPLGTTDQLPPPQSADQQPPPINALSQGDTLKPADAPPPPGGAPPSPADTPPPPGGAPPSPADAPLPGGAPPPPGVRSVVMEWHSCGICLEEMVDTDLLTHKECGAVLCALCLLASSEHSAQADHIPCPICTMMVKPSEAFVPLSSPSKDAVVRLLQTNILFRSANGFCRPTVFGHPAILNLPSSGPGASLYSAVGVLVPRPLVKYVWTLNLTDSKGSFCSRCPFQKGCRGCEVADADISIDLKPGDHLSITFHQLEPESMKEASEAQTHPSLEHRRPNQVTLGECLSVFSQKEVLPWFCPQCKCDREATKVLFPCSYPKTLIVHLKRFLYHNSGVKVETPVSFPPTLEAGGKSLHLVGCVCHFGSLNCGHYTAYCLNQVTSEWYYYNDETATKESPSDKDASSVYLLFYAEERELLSLSLLKPNHMVFNDEEETSVVEQLVRHFKPPPPPQAALQQDNTKPLLSTDVRVAGLEVHTPPSPGAHQDGGVASEEPMDTAPLQHVA